MSSLRDQIANALRGSPTNGDARKAADVVMAVVRTELDQLIEIQVTDLQVAASIAQHEQQRARNAEAERDRLRERVMAVHLRRAGGFGCALCGTIRDCVTQEALNQSEETP